jgi:signal transduction histidine kinase
LAPIDELAGQRAELLVALSAGAVLALIVAAGGGAIIRQEAMGPLKAALKAHRQFMADASHELRTPSSVVRTTAQVMLSSAHRSEAEYRDALGIVADQSVRLTRLVDAMFLLSRAEAQGLPLVREPVYVNDIVAESVRGMRVLANPRGIAIDVHGDPEMPMLGDDGLLRQLFSNLLDNAIRHAQTAVTISLERRPEAAVIRVMNDGPRIPDEDRDRIFERFVRLDQGPGGAGLGLPIARSIAEAHGGQVVLDETTTRRSVCFTVTLPITITAADDVVAS